MERYQREKAAFVPPPLPEMQQQHSAASLLSGRASSFAKYLLYLRVLYSVVKPAADASLLYVCNMAIREETFSKSMFCASSEHACKSPWKNYCLAVVAFLVSDLSFVSAPIFPWGGPGEVTRKTLISKYCKDWRQTKEDGMYESYFLSDISSHRSSVGFYRNMSDFYSCFLCTWTVFNHFKPYSAGSSGSAVGAPQGSPAAGVPAARAVPGSASMGSSGGLHHQIATSDLSPESIVSLHAALAGEVAARLACDLSQGVVYCSLPVAR